jgi:hypothetical protein
MKHFRAVADHHAITWVRGHAIKESETQIFRIF